MELDWLKNRSALQRGPEIGLNGPEQAGRLDGTVADRVEVTAGFLSKPEGRGFGFVGPELRDRRYFGDGMGIALRRGQDELRTQLNNAIRAIRANGTYDRIARLYFDFDIYGD